MTTTQIIPFNGFYFGWKTMKNLILLAIRMARVMRKKMRQDRIMMRVNSQEMAKDPLSSVCQRSSRETHLRKAKHRQLIHFLIFIKSKKRLALKKSIFLLILGLLIFSLYNSYCSTQTYTFNFRLWDSINADSSL